MPARFALWVLVVFFLTGARSAAAQDAAGAESEHGDSTPSQPGDGAAEGGSSGSPDADAGEGAVVIACDGALCDTTQGRPTCAVAPRIFGRGVVDPCEVAGIAGVLALGLVRRAKRGT